MPSTGEGSDGTQCKEAVERALRKVPPRLKTPDTLKSIGYIVFNLMLVLACLLILYPGYCAIAHALKGSAPSLIVLDIFAYGVYCHLAGACIFALYVIGHDGVHHSISSYPILNDVLGQLCVGVIGIPFTPFRITHMLHHLHHNHLDKDAHVHWMEPERFSYLNALRNSPIVSAIICQLGIPLHIYFGALDGSLLFPVFGQLGKYYLKHLSPGLLCRHVLSLAGLCFIQWSIYCIGLWSGISDGSLLHHILWYGGPLASAHQWLFVVAYLEHHDHRQLPKVFHNRVWSFVPGALETVDRTYGYGIDQFFHHATDGHLAHHLMFNGLAHYNLMEVDALLKEYLKEWGISLPRKQDPIKHTSHPFIEFHRTWNAVGLDVFEQIR